MQKIVITDQDAGQRLDKLLGKYMKLAPKSFFYKMLRKKNITLNGKKADGMEKLVAGDEISLFLALETIEKFQEEKNEEALLTDPKVKLFVIYEDEDILVVNKPCGMLSQKADKDDVSLVEYITQYLQENQSQEKEVSQTFKPGVCNRLDRNTSGLMVAGKSIQGLQWMNQLFRERDLDKYYLCIVKGRIDAPCRLDGYLLKNESHNTVTISKEERPGSSRIITEYRPLRHGRLNEKEYTLLKVELVTGKSHQIRAHLESIGHPIIGDGKYGHKDVFQIFKKEFGLRHQLLHSWELHLGSPEYLPKKYHDLVWKAPVPIMFQKIMKGLEME